MASYKKLAGFNRVNWDNKTEKEKARYIKNQYQKLGYKVPKYLERGTISEKQLNSAKNRITNRYERDIKKESLKAQKQKQYEKRRYDNLPNKSMREIGKKYNSLVDKYNNIMNTITMQYVNSRNLSKLEYDYLIGNDIELSIRNKTFINDNPPFKQIEKSYTVFNSKDTALNEINNLREATKKLSLSNIEKTIEKSNTSEDWFTNEYLNQPHLDHLTDNEKEMLTSEFTKMNKLQKHILVKTVLNHIKDIYRKKGLITPESSKNIKNMTIEAFASIKRETN